MTNDQIIYLKFKRLIKFYNQLDQLSTYLLQKIQRDLSKNQSKSQRF